MEVPQILNGLTLSQLFYFANLILQTTWFSGFIVTKGAKKKKEKGRSLLSANYYNTAN